VLDQSGSIANCMGSARTRCDNRVIEALKLMSDGDVSRAGGDKKGTDFAGSPSFSRTDYS